MFLLSYPLGEKTPEYSGLKTCQIVQDKKLSHGDSCRTARISFSNHCGTHIDCPAHFDLHGKGIMDYVPEFWLSTKVQLIHYILRSSEIIEPEMLQQAYESSAVKRPDAEVVIFVTGWHAKRKETIYWQESPGFSRTTAEWLRKTFHQIRFFAFDLISLSSLKNRAEGKLAHTAFLCHNDPILVIEDLNATQIQDKDSLSNLLISPLFVENVDSSVCTIWANISV